MAAGDDGFTHLHLYIHETANTNTTSLSTASTPWFGSMGAIDDELRDGPEPASRRACSCRPTWGAPRRRAPSFTEGDYAGSTLVVDGRVDFGKAAVVGGTGRFRRATGYSLMTRFGNTTPGNTLVFEMDLYVKIIAG